MLAPIFGDLTMLALLSLCAYVVMCCDVRIDAGTKCWSSGKGDYHVGHVTGDAATSDTYSCWDS